MGKTLSAGRFLWMDSKGDGGGVPDGLRDSVKRNWNRFLGYATRKLGNRDQAEEVVRDVVHAAVVANHRDLVAHPDGYLFKAVLRAVRRRLRGDARVTYVGSLGELESVKDAVDVDWVKNLEDHLFVQEFVSAMDDETRDIYLRWANEESWADIAGELGCSIQSSKDKLRNGIRRAKRRLFSSCAVK